MQGERQFQELVYAATLSFVRAHDPEPYGRFARCHLDEADRMEVTLFSHITERNSP